MRLNQTFLGAWVCLGGVVSTQGLSDNGLSPHHPSITLPDPFLGPLIREGPASRTVETDSGVACWRCGVAIRRKKQSRRGMGGSHIFTISSTLSDAFSWSKCDNTDF